MVFVIIVMSLFSLLVLARFWVTQSKEKKFEIWFDGLLVNLLASLIIIITGFVFREKLYYLFEKPGVELVDVDCKKTADPSKAVYHCNLEIKNKTESALSGYKVVISSSSRKYRNHNFVNCQPILADNIKNNITTETKGMGEATCAYRMDLDPFAQVSLGLDVNGGENKVPDFYVLQ